MNTRPMMESKSLRFYLWLTAPSARELVSGSANHFQSNTGFPRYTRAARPSFDEGRRLKVPAEEARRDRMATGFGGEQKCW